MDECALLSKCPSYFNLLNQNFTFNGNGASKLKRGNRERTSVNSKKLAPDNGGHLVREGRSFFQTYHISVGFDRWTDILREVCMQPRCSQSRLNAQWSFSSCKRVISCHCWLDVTAECVKNPSCPWWGKLSVGQTFFRTCCTAMCLHILWMALFLWVPIFVDWAKMTYSWGSKFMAIAIYLIIYTENYNFGVLEIVDRTLHKNHENWYP